ncbi:MAG: YlmC/YmxH family sporulation protein [Defluviitaleaceae bacterium]|nr:YlmC/YmxH family sporulation protein [Defluviitaleaceae bacterium]
MARMYDLRQKEIVNVSDGARYGFVSDLELDITEGTITALIVPGPGRVLGVFGRDQEYKIPWDKIQKIGDDIILVDCTTETVLIGSGNT